MAASSPGKVTRCFSYLCSPRVLLTFGLPLLVPSVILVAIAFVSFPDFGVIHICGIILLVVSVVCILFGALILVYTKLTRKMIPEPDKSSVRELSVNIQQNELPNTDVKKTITARKSSRHRHSNGSVKNKESPRRTRPKRKNSRGVKDAVKNNSIKLATVNEDKEGERLRILSAGGASRKSEPTLPNEILVNKDSLEDTRKSLTRQASLTAPRIEVWKEPSMVSARSDLSIVSDSSIYFTQDVELTPVEVLEQNSFLLSFPPTRSLSLTNILEGSSSDNTDIESYTLSSTNTDHLPRQNDHLLANDVLNLTETESECTSDQDAS